MSSPVIEYQNGPGPAPAQQQQSTWRQRLQPFLSRQKDFLPWYYGAIITLAELLTAFMYIQAGLALHFGLLILLIIHAALAANQPRYPLYQTLALAPLIRILSLTLPLGAFPLIWWYAFTSLPLLTAAGVAAYLAGFKAADLGFTTGRIGSQLLITFSGLLLGLLEYLILRPQPLVPALTPGSIWLPALILLVGTGFTEEFIFRGLMQQAAARAAGPRFALYYVSFIFAVLHITHQSLLDVIFVFAVALFFGRMVQRQGSILGVTLAHGLTNITLYLVWPHLLPF